MRLNPVPENLLLRATSRAKQPFDLGKLQHVVFESGQQLWQYGDTSPYAFFPIRGVISLQIPTGTGKQVEIALVGREGFAGVALVAGFERAPMSAVGIAPGEALVMTLKGYGRNMANPAFREAIEQYRQLFVTMLSRLLVCNRVHVIEKLCVARLLLIQDRWKSDSVRLTQEVFAKHLGVRRATISRAVADLQKRGVISYDRRGCMTIVDRVQLERLACPCYHAMKAEFDRLVQQQGGL